MLISLLMATWTGVDAGPSPQSATTESKAPELEWSPFEGEASDGTSLAGQSARIQVPETRGDENSPLIGIDFVRFASTSPDPGPPIYYLIGGPGATASDHAAREATIPEIGLLEFGDVIGINQRGTGDCAFNAPDAPGFYSQLPLDAVVTREDRLAAQAEQMAECHAYWTERGVQLDSYNSIESASDIDAVREALGHDKIVLWGTSYGSHLSLAYLREYSEHVERAVLMKVEGPDQTFKLPSLVDGQLDRLQEHIDRDDAWAEKMPDVKGLIAELVAQLEKEPVEVVLEPPGRDPIHLLVGAHDLQVMIAVHLGFTEMIARLPAILFDLGEGEWRMLGMAAMNLRGVGVESPMAMMMDASSGGSKERLAQIQKERESGRYALSDAMNFNHYPETASACGHPDVGRKFRGALRCSVPVLFVSGDLDARTPPENVEQILGTFRKASHVLVRGTGHDSRELISPEYCALVRSFLAGNSVESQEIELPPFELMPGR